MDVRQSNRQFGHHLGSENEPNFHSISTAILTAATTTAVNVVYAKPKTKKNEK